MQSHSQRALSEYPGDPPDYDLCTCHCHHPVDPSCDCDCCQGNHDPDLCAFPGTPPHVNRGGVCECRETPEEAKAFRLAEEHYDRNIAMGA